MLPSLINFNLMGWHCMFPGLAKKEGVAQPSLPPGLRVYAVGDIHGELGLLGQLHEIIRQDLADAPHLDTVKIIYLGDYINRGGQSRQVLDALRTIPVVNARPLFLMGNHELALIKFLTAKMEYHEWLRWGGDQTLLSYGVDVISPYSDSYEIAQLRQTFREVIPLEHYRFLSKLKPYAVEGEYIFVHAGLRPGVELEEQKLQDLVLIRKDFLKKPVTCGKTVIHGHTVFNTPHIRKNRHRIDSIGIDTGAYNSGKLTAIVLEGASYRFLNTAYSLAAFKGAA